MSKIRLYKGNSTSKYWLVEWSPATKPVVLTRTQKDILTGKVANPAECADANCAMRLKNLFPHPVRFAYFIGSRAYIVDKIEDGEPVHCVKYKHDDKSIQVFDKLKPAAFAAVVAEDGSKDTKIKLSPPSHPKASGAAKKRGAPSTQEGQEGTRSPHIPRGLKKRLIDAGLLTVS